MIIIQWTHLFHVNRSTTERHPPSTNIVISLSKIRDRDWSYTRHVICTNNYCWPCSGQQYRSALPAFAADFWSERYIRYINYIFCVV